jgi:DNA methylase
VLCQTCAGDLRSLRSTKKFCSNACRTAYHRGKRPDVAGIPLAPVVHCGRFQDYEERYAGMLDVIVTDPPYSMRFLPLYEDLGRFAKSTLRPGGWLLCLTGWGMDWWARKYWDEVGLWYVTTGCYATPGGQSQAAQKTPVGTLLWKQHHKPLLWYLKPGTPHDKRRGGSQDDISACVVSAQEPSGRRWEQSLSGFQEIVRLFTNPNDVICDPCAGWGTTLVAAVLGHRDRVIGIETLPDRYAFAQEQVALALAQREAYERPPAPPDASSTGPHARKARKAHVAA